MFLLAEYCRCAQLMCSYIIIVMDKGVGGIAAS